MSYAVTWSERAVFAGSRYLSDDPAGLTQVLEATDLLVDDPRPNGAFPYGSMNLLRIRVERYRILYEIYPDEQLITVLNVARIA